MDKFSSRAVIQYLQKKRMLSKEIHEDIVATLENDAPSFATVKKWTTEFRRGKESLEDDPKPGRPCTATTDEMADKVLDMVMLDRCVTTRTIAGDLQISQERVQHIISHIHGMHKVSSRWVPRLLTNEQKRMPEVLSRQ